MKWLVALPVVVALGIAAGELLSRLPRVRDGMSRLLGRGELLAVVQHRGIYEAELEAEDAELNDLIIAENLRVAAASEQVESTAVEREAELLRDQFASRERFASALQRSGLSEADLRVRIAEQLRGLRWIEARIAPVVSATDEECRAWFAQHAGRFQLPPRFHVAHIFLAAHAQTPPETTQAKREQIQEIADRLKHRADFEQLAAEFSEDEATKARGGDLGFIAQSRVPAEIFAEIAKLKPGTTGAPFQSHLGFHIFRLIEKRPARAMSFEEARSEMAAELRNAKRRAACERLVPQLVAAEYRAPLM